MEAVPEARRFAFLTDPTFTGVLKCRAAPVAAERAHKTRTDHIAGQADDGNGPGLIPVPRASQDYRRKK